MNRHLVIIASLVASSMPIILFLPSEPVMASVEDYLWISDGDDSIYQVDASNPEVIVDSYDFGTSSPFGCEENDGYIFFIDYGTDTLYQKLWSDKSEANSWLIGSYSGNPSGVAYDGGEYFWISDSSDDQVYKVAAADPTTYVYIITYTGISTVEGVGWNDDNNRLLVTDTGTDLIYSFDVSGVPDSGQGTTNLTPDWSFAAPGTYPVGIVWDGAFFWSIDDGTNSLYKHNTDGSVAATYDPPGGDPQGLAFRAGVPLVYPTKPILYLPSDGATLTDNKPYFEWALADDADNHRLLVDVSPPDWAGNAIDVTVEDNDYTAVAPLADDNYSWKVIAVNENGDNESDVWTFYMISPTPTQPILYLPDDDATLGENTPYFEWTVGENAANHLLYVDNDSNFSSLEENQLLTTDNFYTIASENALPNDNYYWKVTATNENGENASATWTFAVDVIPPPAAPILLFPNSGITTTDNTPYFEWENSTENSWLLIDDDIDFSSPTENRLIIANTSYAIPQENALANGIYHWKVVDTNNNESPVWHFTLELKLEVVAFDDTELREIVYIALAFGSFGVVALALQFGKKKVEK